MSERLGYTINRLLSELSSPEISEYMAFDRLKDENYLDSIKSEMMTDEERNAAIDKLLGFRVNNDN